MNLPERLRDIRTPESMCRREGDDFIFKRAMFAGNVIATVKLEGALKFLTVRAAAFAHPPKGSESSPVESVPVDAGKLPAFIEFGGQEAKVAGRPDSTEARVVVSGGRAIKNAEDFERLIGGLADALGGAVGSSRALVDAGITPNSLQVGQTGKIVAPDLYIAVGISGASGHGSLPRFRIRRNGQRGRSGDSSRQQRRVPRSSPHGERSQTA